MTESSEAAIGPTTDEGPDAPVTEAEPEPGIAGEVSAALAGLVDRPVEEHPEVYEAVHRRLGDTLSGIDHV